MSTSPDNVVERGTDTANDIEILVVEDSATQARQLAQLLETVGYRVRIASDGRAGRGATAGASSAWLRAAATIVRAAGSHAASARVTTPV
ncbi:hypothetical protein ACCD08_31670, partial [Telluria sp. Tellsp104]